jgi:hypothetical protein
MPHHAALLILAVAGTLSGCGPRGPERFQLTGEVTFDGSPVPSGVIRFEADATLGNSGPVGYAVIKDGRYTTAEQGSKGALKGPLVAIMTGGPAPNPNVEFPVMWFTEYTTKIVLEPKGGVATFDFDVPREQKK